MSEGNRAQPNQAPHVGEAAGQPRDPLATVLSDVVSGLDIESMGGEAVFDEFVGALVAIDGVITSSGESQGPREILAAIAENPIDRPNIYLPHNVTRDEWLKTFTKGNGLRAAVLLLTGDARISASFPNAQNRLAINRHTGDIMMTSPAQVGGYLKTLAHLAGANPDETGSWIGPIVQDMTTHNVDQNVMQGAVAEAEKAGADQALLAASDVHMQRVAYR